jgi:hypothetical protein
VCLAVVCLCCPAAVRYSSLLLRLRWRRGNDGDHTTAAATERSAGNHFRLSEHGHDDGGGLGGNPDGYRLSVEFVSYMERSNADVNVRERDRASIHIAGKRCGDCRFGTDLLDLTLFLGQF